MENSLKLRSRATADEKQTLGKKILTAVFVFIEMRRLSRIEQGDQAPEEI